MLNDIFTTQEERMKKSIESLRREYGSLRAGRATPALLDGVMVEYYGTPTPINQVANVSVPEPRMISIAPWDKSMVQEIEKAIMKSDLGLNPNSDGAVIRLTIPQLTQETRMDLVKTVNKKAEEAKIAIRNIRRDGMDGIKELEKEKEITEDQQDAAETKLQKIVDKYIEMIDQVRDKKEQEIMEV